jgi:hypothetical protein
MADDRRILVLGSEGHGREVHAWGWRALPENLNVADYDTVVLNFIPLEDDQTRTNVDLRRVPETEQFARLIFSQGSTVLAIGRLGIQFGQSGSDARFPGSWTYKTTEWWLPVDVAIKNEGGEAIRSVADGWESWFDHVARFDWHFVQTPTPTREEWVLRAVLEAVPRAHLVAGEWDHLAETRFGEPVGVRMRLFAVRQETGSSRWGGDQIETVAESGNIYWLPSPTDISDHEGVDLVLREFLGVAASAPEPPWRESFRLPREKEALTRIEVRREELALASSALKEAEAIAAAEASFGRLLFEQGKEALEGVARDALAELGADVSEPVAQGIEDGRLTDPSGRPAMLEIKGRAGPIGLDDVRQLSGWMTNAIADEQWEGKGLLVANPRRSEPPHERKDHVAPNALAFAQRIGVAILLTTQIFEALRLHQLGEFDNEAFWNRVFTTSGLCDLPEPRPGD